MSGKKYLNFPIFVSLALLVGCTQENLSATKADPGTCNLATAGSLVGMRLGDVTGKELPANRRVVLANTSLESSPDPSRLTIIINSSEVVSGVQCG